MINEDKKEKIYVIARRIYGRTSETSPDSEQIEHTVATATFAKLCERGVNPRQSASDAAIQNYSTLTPHPNPLPQGAREQSYEIPKQVRDDMRGKFLVPQCPSILVPLKKVAFTLAEVLITLGIIGVVAAMTLPTLIENHNKKVVASRLQKFYSSMNQAIQRAENDYGSRDTWFLDTGNKEKQKEWVEKYFVPYLNVTKVGIISETTDPNSSKHVALYFADGSSAAIATSFTRDWYFYSGNPEKCMQKTWYKNNEYLGNFGTCAFAFYYSPTSNSRIGYSFEPYNASGQENEYNLKHSGDFACYRKNTNWNLNCTALIQYNGWKFPKDYPYKVKYR